LLFIDLEFVSVTQGFGPSKRNPVVSTFEGIPLPSAVALSITDLPSGQSLSAVGDGSGLGRRRETENAYPSLFSRAFIQIGLLDYVGLRMIMFILSGENFDRSDWFISRNGP
jgi:hypothetical protein